MQKLISNLEHHFTNKLKELIPFLESYKYDNEEMYKYYNFEKGKYTRNLIYKNDKFDIFLIVWDKGSNAPIHDHAMNGCIYKILEGEIIETLYDNNVSFIGSNTLNKNDIGYIDNSIGYHSIINKTQFPAISMHIYSPPNHKTIILEN